MLEWRAGNVLLVELVIARFRPSFQAVLDSNCFIAVYYNKVDRSILVG
jgi:hypothetical protein